MTNNKKSGLSGKATINSAVLSDNSKKNTTNNNNVITEPSWEAPEVMQYEPEQWGLAWLDFSNKTGQIMDLCMQAEKKQVCNANSRKALTIYTRSRVMALFTEDRDSVYNDYMGLYNPGKCSRFYWANKKEMWYKLEGNYNGLVENVYENLFAYYENMLSNAKCVNRMAVAEATAHGAPHVWHNTRLDYVQWMVNDKHEYEVSWRGITVAKRLVTCSGMAYWNDNTTHDTLWLNETINSIISTDLYDNPVPNARLFTICRALVNREDTVFFDLHEKHGDGSCNYLNYGEYMVTMDYEQEMAKVYRYELNDYKTKKQIGGIRIPEAGNNLTIAVDIFHVLDESYHHYVEGHGLSFN